METGFDSRTQRLGDPVICTQLYFCGGGTDEQIEKIMKQGFSKEGNYTITWIIRHFAKTYTSIASVCIAIYYFKLKEKFQFFSDFTRGPYGKGLYFSMQASQAAAFSAVKYQCRAFPNDVY